MKKTVRVEDDKDYVFDVVHQVLFVKELPPSIFFGTEMKYQPDETHRQR